MSVDESSTPLISVVLCTFNPRWDYFSLALRSLACQSLPYDHYEIIIVDNNSEPALDWTRVERMIGRDANVTIETRQGLTFARIAGIEASVAPLIVFVDDDNELDPDYLKYALEIADEHPELGSFGGVTEGVLEIRANRIKQRYLPHLGVRDNGGQRIEGSCLKWGLWEPIGAGLVVRRDVGRKYTEFVNAQREAGALGRTGARLMSGEDTLMTRLAGQLGYRCSYEPSLKLRHYISRNRLTYRYLAKLVNGHGRSFVALAQLLGDHDSLSGSTGLRARFDNLIHRIRTEGAINALGMWFWDLGYESQIGYLRGQGMLGEGSSGGKVADG